MLERILMATASGIWGTGSQLTRAFSKWRPSSSRKLPVRVISVGNLQVGGTGKTPVVAQIAREAAERGLQACILIRGYRGHWETTGGVILPGEAAPSSRLCGDEPALLHELAPKALIGVGANRLIQFEEVARREKVDLVILDDGFQYRKIRKDLEILLVTSYGPSEVLFREKPTAARFADMVIWTKGSRNPPVAAEPHAKLRLKLKPAERQEPVWLVTGVADSDEVRKSAEEAGYIVERHVRFRDHMRYDQAMVQSLQAEAGAQGKMIALTGKDWVKWREQGVLRESVIVLEPEIVFESGQDTWRRLLWGA